MRRIALLVGLISLVALPSSLASAAGKPTRLPVPNAYDTFTFRAGLACSFALGAEPVVNNEVFTIFPAEANGDIVQLVTGSLLEQLTNLKTGKSIIVNISGPETYVYHTDGSVTFIARGASLAFFFPTDIPAGPTTYINYGQYVLTITPTDQFILQSQTGTQFDVCAALS